MGLASGIEVGSCCPLTIGCLVDRGPCCLDRAVLIEAYVVFSLDTIVIGDVLGVVLWG